MLTVQWVKCGTDWCPFETVNLSNVTTTGIYLIWHGGNPSKMVRIGQGDVAKRIAAHRSDPACKAYRQHGMYVTWAAVSAQYRDGVKTILLTITVH